MPLNNPTPGLGATSEYMASALPWMTSSVLLTGETKEYNFDFVSKWVMVKNQSAGTTINVGVTRNGVQGSNYFTLIGGESVNLDWRLVKLYVSASVGAPSVAVIAGLTTIPLRQAGGLQMLTGSNQWNGVG